MLSKFFNLVIGSVMKSQDISHYQGCVFMINQNDRVHFPIILSKKNYPSENYIKVENFAISKTTG